MGNILNSNIISFVKQNNFLRFIFYSVILLYAVIFSVSYQYFSFVGNTLIFSISSALLIQFLYMIPLYLFQKITYNNYIYTDYEKYSKKSKLVITLFISIIFILAKYITIRFIPYSVDSLNETAISLLRKRNSFEFIIFIGILGPVFEELIFRKFLMETFSKLQRKSYLTNLSVILSAVIFGLVHFNIGDSITYFFFVFSMGLSFGMMYEEFQDIRVSMFIHIVFNLSNIVFTQ